MTGTDLGLPGAAALQTRWVDLAMLGLLALSIVGGLLRGLVFELLSLAGWVAAFLLAQQAAPLVAPHLPSVVPDGAPRTAAAFASAFVAALVLWALLARLVHVVVRASPLDALDRVFGAAFGALRGTVVLLAVATVVGLTPLRNSAAWRASQGAVWLNDGLHAVRPLLPAGLSRHLPA